MQSLPRIGLQSAFLLKAPSFARNVASAVSPVEFNTSSLSPTLPPWSLPQSIDGMGKCVVLGRGGAAYLGLLEERERLNRMGLADHAPPMLAIGSDYPPSSLVRALHAKAMLFPDFRSPLPRFSAVTEEREKRLGNALMPIDGFGSFTHVGHVLVQDPKTRNLRAIIHHPAHVLVATGKTDRIADNHPKTWTAARFEEQLAKHWQQTHNVEQTEVYDCRQWSNLYRRFKKFAALNKNQSGGI